LLRKAFGLPKRKPQGAFGFHSLSFRSVSLAKGRGVLDGQTVEIQLQGKVRLYLGIDEVGKLSLQMTGDLNHKVVFVGKSAKTFN